VRRLEVPELLVEAGGGLLCHGRPGVEKSARLESGEALRCGGDGVVDLWLWLGWAKTSAKAAAGEMLELAMYVTSLRAVTIRRTDRTMSLHLSALAQLSSAARLERDGERFELDQSDFKHST
jgi:hypothetical protein